MEPMFELNTEYSYDEYKAFTLFTMKKNKRVIIAAITAALLMIFSLVTGNIYVSIFLLLYAALILFAFEKKLKKAYELNNSRGNGKIRFRFYENYFEAETTNGTSNIEYTKLQSIIEAKTEFYLMLSDKQGFMLAKDNLPGDLDDFLRFQQDEIAEFHAANSAQHEAEKH